MEATEAAAGTSAPVVPTLDWLGRALFTDDGPRLRRAGVGDPEARWLARPASGEPELLVPLASRRAAAATSRRYWDGMPARRRLRQWVGEAALRTGLVQRTWPTRVAVADGDLDDPDRSLVAHLARVLGEGRLVAAMTARPAQYNAKPVLALFDERGDAVAFAKVAVDEVSESYVRTEHRWLGRAAAAAPPLRAPKVLDLTTWAGRPVLVLEPLALPRVPRRRPGWARQAIADAVLGLGEVEEVPVAEAAAVRRAAQEAAEAADPVLTEAVERLVGRHGHRSIEVGPWHGDLSPWNTASRRREVLVWDWELAGEGMPVGSDLRHEEVMVATHLQGVAARAALQALDPADPAVAVYLLEVARRDRQARRAGRVDAGHDLGPAALARLGEDR